MSTVNKVILVGNLGKDPEMRMTGAGDPIANLSIATSEKWNDKSTGERKERTEWHRVVIFNEQIAKLVESYAHKGSKVYLEGQLQTRKYEQNGVEKYVTEIVLQRYRGELVLLGDAGGGNRIPPADSADSYGSTRTRNAGRTSDDPRTQMSSRPELDDDIPF